MRPMLCTKTIQKGRPKDEFQRHEGRGVVPADRLGPFNLHGNPSAIPLARCTRMVPYKHCFRLHAQLFPGYISYLHSFSYPTAATPWCLRFLWRWQRFISHVRLHHDGYSQGFQGFEVSRCWFSFVGDCWCVSFLKPSQKWTQSVTLASCPTLRLYYSGPGILKSHCFPGKNDVPILGSIFKASHCKSLLWWLAMRTSSAANASPGETLTVLVLSTGYYLFILVKCPDISILWCGWL